MNIQWLLHGCSRRQGSTEMLVFTAVLAGGRQRSLRLTAGRPCEGLPLPLSCPQQQPSNAQNIVTYISHGYHCYIGCNSGIQSARNLRALQTLFHPKPIHCTTCSISVSKHKVLLLLWMKILLLSNLVLPPGIICPADFANDVSQLFQG